MKTLLLGSGNRRIARVHASRHRAASAYSRVHRRAAVRAPELQTAAHDFGGHRVEAIRAIDVAMKHLRLAQQFDK